jgi:hypothetical protein
MHESDSELRTQVDQLQRELVAMRAWCAGLEEQQAQLAAVLTIVAPKVAGLGLTRFPLSAALPDEFSAHGQG